MDSFSVIIQILSIVTLLVLIGFFSVGIYILVVISSRLKEILELLDTAKKLNEKFKQFQSSVAPQFKNGFSHAANVVMNILTTILYRK